MEENKEKEELERLRKMKNELQKIIRNMGRSNIMFKNEVQEILDESDKEEKDETI